MSNNVYVYSIGKFNELTEDFLKNKSIIRIHNIKDKEWYDSEIKNGIVLFFNDISSDELGFFDKIKAGFSNARCSYFTKDDAIKIIKFINTEKKKDIVIHCQFGKSRSVGVALYLKQYHQYTIINKEVDALKNYNTWVLELLSKYN